MKKFIFATAFVFMAFIWASGAQAATLSLSPGSGSNSVGSIFTVTILLNTQSQAVDGVDIRYLNYSPTLLEAQDENTSQAGVQISAGTLLGNTVANSVDTANGRISFSQVAVGGSTYSNATGAALATVRFRVLTTGTAPVTFSFTSGSTADTNVAAGGSDVLTAVTNGSYTLQDTVAPSAPTGLVVTAVSSSQINLSWTASTDNIGVTGYRVERCQGSGCSNFTQIATPAGTSYSDTGLSASTVYAYRVRATDAAGNLSSYSGTASAATPALPDTTPPAAIANFSTSKATLNSVTLSWTAPGDDGNTGTAASYDIRYSTSNITTANWGSVTQATGEPTPQAAGTAQSMVISGLTSNTIYYFAIKATDDAGNISGLSNIASASTQALTLAVALTATPSSGQAPLNGVDLSVTVSGTATGNINYTFYCNRSDSGTNVTAPYDAKYDNQTVATMSVADVCNYLNMGTYTAKVIVERGALAAENRTDIAVSNPPMSTKFSTNDRMKVASDVNVRSSASVSAPLLGSQIAAALGTVIGGPTYADGYWWWQINYDINPDGWSIENSIDLPPVISGAVFTPTLEGVVNINARGFTFNIYNAMSVGNQALFTASGNASNQVILPSNVTNLREDRYNIYVESAGYLKAKTADTRIASGATVSLPVLKAGDLNDDGIINSLDWSSMNTNWFTGDAISDINRDGIVNSIDFSWMNKNWLQSDAA